jgi:hypothetical protein
MPHDYHHRLQYCEWLFWEHERERAFWSTSCGRTKQHAHVKVSSTVTTAICGHSIIPMQHASGAINFVWVLMCGLVSLAIVWLGHTYYPTASMTLRFVCSCRKYYRCCLKMCHWRFDVTCGFNTMGRRRILVHRPNSTSTQFPDRWLGRGGPVSWPAWPAWSPDLNPLVFFLWDTWEKLFTGIRQLTWKTWQQRFMLLWRPLMQTCYDVCKLVFHDVWLHVGDCMVDTLNTYCNYRPLSYVSAVFCQQGLYTSPDMCELCILLMYTILLY